MGMTHNKMEFAFDLARHSNAAGMGDVNRLLRLGATCKRFAEAACNRELSSSEQERWMRIRKQIQDRCKSFGAVAIFQNDPRGATVKIKVLDGFTNDWGQVGICVPTS